MLRGSAAGDTPTVSAAAMWLPGAAAGPDPEELARCALASITLRQPELTIMRSPSVRRPLLSPWTRERPVSRA